MYFDTDDSIPDDDELHGPHFGDSDVEEVPFDEPDDLLYFDDSDE
jgi:hypothetical protein